MNDSTDIRLIEMQFLSKVLLTKNIGLIIDNGINESYFAFFSKEFKYILSHYEQYKTVPDTLTFVKNFDSWETLDTQESDKYLVDNLIKNKRLTDVVNKFNTIRQLLQDGKYEEAFEVEQQKLDYTAKNYLKDVPNIFSATEVNNRFSEYADKMINNSSYFITTGFPELDEAFGGGWDRKEEFATIVARPGVGKSWILLTTALAASKKGFRVGLFSGEMTKNKVGYRLDTLRTHISNSSISHGRRDVQNDYKRYLDDAEEGKDEYGPIYVATIADDFDGKTPTIKDFETFINKYNLDIFCLDQQSLMDDIEHSKNPIDKAGNIAKELKLLQTTTKIPIITVCQQNRTGEQATDKNGNHKDVEYDVSRIAQSDKIGQYSTVVIFLDYNRELQILTLHPAKVRDGGCSKIQYNWNIDKGTFAHVVVDMGQEGAEEECEERRKEFEGDGDINW